MNKIICFSGFFSNQQCTDLYYLLFSLIGVSDYSHLPLKELVIKLEPCDIPVHIQASVDINRIVPFQPPPKLASSMSAVVNTPKVAPTLIPLTEVLTMHECEVVDCGFRTPKRQILEKHMALHPPERISLSRMYQLQKVAESHSIKISGIRQLKKAQPALNVTIPKNDDKQHKKLQKGKRKDKEQVAPKERLNPIPIACKPPEYPILSSNGLISNGLVYLPITQKSSNVTTSVHQVTNTSHDSSFQKLTVPAMPAHSLNGVVNGGTLPVASDLQKLSDTSPSTAMLLHKTIRSETVQSIANLDQVLQKLPGAECESSDGISSEDEDVLATRYDIDRMLKNDSRGEDNSSLNTIDKLADQLPPYERKKMKKKYRPYKKQKRVMRKCTECDFTTDRQDKMAAHMNEHAGVMNECDEPGCTYKSYNLAHLKCHKYKRHRIDRKERVLCELCGADVSKENLQNHKLAKHFPERMKKKKCKYCDYEAYDSKRIIRHQRIHTGEKPHKCPHCDYSSNQSCNLKTHLRTHSGNKPFKCTHCDFAAAHNVTLKGHMKTKHSGVSG